MEAPVLSLFLWANGMQVMTKEAAKKRDLCAELEKKTAPAAGTFQHFQNEQARQEHLREVEEAQKQGSPF